MLITDWSVNTTLGSLSALVIPHMRIVWSSDPETICCPSGENATTLTDFVCPVNGPATISPVVAFQIQMVLSCDPETICCPSGENATKLTDFVCSVNGPATISPVAAFQI
jgi:hypothetical protein